MKKVAYVLFPLIIVFLIVINLFFPVDNYKDFQKIDYKLSGKSYKLLIADTPQKWEKGLMNFRKLDGVSGMIFLFPDKQYRSFWNKNTLMNLDLYWLDDDKILGRSYLPSIEISNGVVIVNSPVPANKVIEFSSR